MKKQLLAIALIGILAAIFWPRSAAQKKQHQASHAPTTSSDERGVVPIPIRATSNKPPPPAHEIVAETPVAEERIVHLSSPEQREGEADLSYELRTSWLKGFHSFERRALMTKEQHDQLVVALADAQEQAVLNWQEINRALGDPNNAYGPEGVLVTFDKLMNKELLVMLRTFLSHEQMVAFRRTLRVPAALASGRILPLEITREPISPMTDALSAKQRDSWR